MPHLPKQEFGALIILRKTNDSIFILHIFQVYMLATHTTQNLDCVH